MTVAGNLKKGEFIKYQGDIWHIQKSEFYSPGKGSALMRTKIKSVKTGKNIDYTFKSQENVETLEVNSIEMQYLYSDVENAYFMNERTYNQYPFPLSVIGNAIKFFKEGDKMFVYLHNEVPISVMTPLSASLKVKITEDAVKGDTVSGGKKEAELETGAKVMVPLFVKVGDTISVNPTTGAYNGRV